MAGAVGASPSSLREVAMLVGIIDLGVALVVFAAVLAVGSLVLDLMDPEPYVTPRAWWRRF